MKIPAKIKIKTYNAKKGENVVNLLIAFASEFVVIKNKLNEIIDYLETQKTCPDLLAHKNTKGYKSNYNKVVRGGE
jgi:hypothetical protein